MGSDIVHKKDKVYSAVADCVFHPQYSVGIFLNSSEKQVHMLEDILAFVSRIYGSQEIDRHSTDGNFSTIKFCNGSVAHIFNVNSMPNWKARRYHQIIYDTDIDKLYVDHLILRLMLHDAKVVRIN